MGKKKPKAEPLIHAYWATLPHDGPAPSVRPAGYGRVALGCRPGAHHAGLRLEDVPCASFAKIARQRRLDAQVRRALGLVLRRRPKRPR